MTGATEDTGTCPPPRGRAKLKPIAASIALASPLLLLVLLDAAALVQSLVDPSSTCWLEPLKEAGEHHLFPFEIHLLFFTATATYWVPINLLMVVLFVYVGWIYPRELISLALLYGVVLYFVGFEYRWLVDIYLHQYAIGCG